MARWPSSVPTANVAGEYYELFFVWNALEHISRGRPNLIASNGVTFQLPRRDISTKQRRND